MTVPATATAATVTVTAKRDHPPQPQQYRPKVGEILVKDSILYSQKPAAVRHLRRQLWPFMESTMDSIAQGVATGAKLLHHMMRPNLIVTGDPVYLRRVPATLHIKNVYMPQALTGLKRPSRQPKKALLPPPTTTTTTVAPFKMPKPTMIVVGEQPVNTISENYVLRYKGANSDPTYAIRSHTKPNSPFADMGVTGYRHFEATVLRELEEKEERKVEDLIRLRRPSDGGQDSDNETHDWEPMMSVSSTLKPREESHLHTNTSGQDIKPVYEELQETKGAPVGVNAPKVSRYMARKPHKPTVVATVAPTTPSPKSTTDKPTTTVKTLLDVPNYPDFFIQQNRHLQPVPRANVKPKSNATAIALVVERTTAMPPPKPDDLNGALDFGRYRMHFQHIGASVAQSQQRPQRVALDMDASQSQSKSTVLVSTRPARTSNRHAPERPPKVASDAPAAEEQRPTATSRGKVRFGDRVES